MEKDRESVAKWACGNWRREQPRSGAKQRSLSGALIAVLHPLRVALSVACGLWLISHGAIAVFRARAIAVVVIDVSIGYRKLITWAMWAIIVASPAFPLKQVKIR